MSKPLSKTTIAIVKATVPALASHGQTITREMYVRLFQDDRIRALFNQSHQGEGGAQANARLEHCAIRWNHLSAQKYLPKQGARAGWGNPGVLSARLHTPVTRKGPQP